ncbi:hypothetical protein FT663_02867 [Candidozyma haemuli var. vulneris]|uniref:Uncharacterized protein n=1 Tax=Candidozyma haemuli TaxID=45357 RepID=A0A2V1AW17_9ASCO|nr:hypothetical protein CXQ85_005328 [[Candida] haemuloni]KAF3989577.1 hypothetical protein FT662_02747 [[Candida] haemuloni var. vulneris]KAF3991140.1 hypothetical protein FT663_02867 [[Candida] haemuloni var. vulneris]PVH22300.1 hypothetical protein CXQ85_005328 [[Candida] haemuloni]
MDLPPQLAREPPLKLTHAAAGIFPVIFLVTWPLWYICSEYKSYITKNVVLAFLNYFFIQQYGYLLFTIAYLSQGVFYVDGQTQQKDKIYSLMFKYGVITLLGMVFHGGFLSFSLVEMVNKATGGYCEGGTTKTTMSQCSANPDLQWIDGFDISSHYYFLSSSVILLLNNLLNNATESADIEAQVEEEPKSGLILKARKVVTYLTSLLISIWMFEFVITSLFFHTPFERFMGLVGCPAALFTISFSDRLFSQRTDYEDPYTP